MPEKVMNAICPASHIKLAGQAADAAAKVICNYFRNNIHVYNKKDSTPVTDADRNAEVAIRKIIEAEAPEHGIYGEEFGTLRPDAEYLWVLDPIDGTRSFISGVPLFGTLIALLHEGHPILGLMNQPITKERWLGVKGYDTTFNGMSVKSGSCNILSEATLFTTDPDLFEGAQAIAYIELAKTVKQRRYGIDCYAYGLLASGYIDLVCEADLQPYDYTALVPIIEGAGGIISDWAGNPLSLDSDGTVLAACCTTLHDAAKEILIRKR